MAAAALRGDRQVLDALASSLIRVERDNLVERPWGGDWLKAFKRLPDDAGPGAGRWGEAFELAAFDADDEAGRYPSAIRFDDGARAELPVLLDAQADALLGAEFVGRHGARFPLLPKFLDVKELLSVQGHPPGHTEVYVIVDAEPGATLRLGFDRDVDREALARELSLGLKQQSDLLELLPRQADAAGIQEIVAPWLAVRGLDAVALLPWIESAFGPNRADAATVLSELKALYWRVLDSMNAIAVEPGQVIYNATPKRLLEETGSEPAAEVHALGNPEGREILALEIRRPGPTFRAWDNVRFPQREVDVESALDALNLRATRPAEFVRERFPVAGRPGASVSVDCEYFRVEHLAPDSEIAVDVPASGPHSLHCLAGSVVVRSGTGRPVGSLDRGDSALVPVGVGAYRVEASAPADVVRVQLPEH